MSVDATFDDGWDSAARLVDGCWLDRMPRRPEVGPRLRIETRLLPWLAELLPLEVPRPFVLREEPLVVRHALVAGEPLDEAMAEAGATERGAAGPTMAAHGAALGAFLRALHAVDVGDAAAHGAPPAGTAALALREELERMRRRVVPLLPADGRSAGRALLDAVAAVPSAVALVHGDLGPEHLLAHAGRLRGVIDWSDAHVGDPALDLAWALHGTTPPFAAGLAAAYGRAAEALSGRALLWHRLGPWYEVLHGLDTEAPETVAAGLDGVLARL